jgi:hypothetical protein
MDHPPRRRSGAPGTREFDEVWRQIRALLATRTTVPTWSRDGRVRTPPFQAWVDGDVVMVDPPDARGLQRVRRGDFEVIHALWDGYLRESVGRQELTDLSRSSTYVISILRLIGT